MYLLTYLKNDYDVINDNTNISATSKTAQPGYKLQVNHASTAHLPA